MSHVVWLTSLETLTSKSNYHISHEDMKCESSLAFVSKSHQDTLKHSSQEQGSHLCFLPFLFFPVLSDQPLTSILLSNILSWRCQFFLAPSWLWPSSLVAWFLLKSLFFWLKLFLYPFLKSHISNPFSTK